MKRKVMVRADETVIPPDANWTPTPPARQTLDAKSDHEGFVHMRGGATCLGMRPRQASACRRCRCLPTITEGGQI